jgi:hypothetical protein
LGLRCAFEVFALQVHVELAIFVDPHFVSLDGECLESGVIVADR